MSILSVMNEKRNYSEVSEADDKIIIQAKGLLKEWAATQENYKYHNKWIDKLDYSSHENLFNSYKNEAPNTARKVLDKRLQYLLLK